MGRSGMGKMKVVFFGTPDYVVPIAKILDEKFDVLAVVTQTPKKVGRKKILTPSPIEIWAKKNNIEVIYNLREIPDYDLGVLASFGRIVPNKVLTKPKHGIINIHPSDLPLWRGSSPVQATILSEEKMATVSIMLLDEKMDHGPILAKFEEKITSNDTTEVLRKRLFKISTDHLSTIIPMYVGGKITPTPQDHKKATYTKELKKDHAFIPPKYFSNALKGKTTNEKWNIPFLKDYSIIPNSENVEKFIRAANPWPIAWTKIIQQKNKNPLRLKIIESHVEGKNLVPDIVQLEGKNPVSWKQFVSGYPESSIALGD